MKKGNFFRGYGLVLLAVSVLWMGCPQSAEEPDPALSVPRNVQAERLPEDQLQVTWDIVEGATKYQIANAEGAPQQEITPPVILSDIGENYSVKVRAGNDAGVWSDWSNPATGGYYSVAGAPIVPVTGFGGEAAYEVGNSTQDDNEIIQQWYAMPRSGKDTSLLSGVVMATWPAAEGATKYDIYYIKHAASEYTGSALTTTPGDEPPNTAEKVSDHTKTSYFVRDVEAGGGVTFWVQVKNEYGAGPVSAPFTRQVDPNKNVQTARGAGNGEYIERADYPKNLKVRVTGEGEVTLSWDRSDRAVWYEVYYRPMLFSIKADKMGTGTYAGAPDDGYSLDNASQMGYGGSAPRGFPSPGFINDYTPENMFAAIPYLGFYNADGADNLQDIATPWNDKESKAGEIGKVYKIHSLETVITGLDPNRGYYFWVRGLNHNGERGIARSDRFVINDPAFSGVVPAPVVQVESADAGSLNVSWNGIPGATGYNVYYSQYPTPLLSLPAYPVTMDYDTFDVATSVTLEALEAGTKYYVWVVTQYGDRSSGFSKAAIGVPN